MEDACNGTGVYFLLNICGGYYCSKNKINVMEAKNKIIEDWLSNNFKEKEATDNFWGRSAICKPVIQENSYIKNNETEKIKVNGVTFRYMASGAMPLTKTYQVLYKILKH